MAGLVFAIGHELCVTAMHLRLLNFCIFACVCSHVCLQTLLSRQDTEEFKAPVQGMEEQYGVFTTHIHQSDQCP